MSKKNFKAAKAAKAGMRIQTVTGQLGTLTKKLGGLWYAHMDATGDERCIGGGYDFTLQP